jgi:hypothetical protein
MKAIENKRAASIDGCQLRESKVRLASVQSNTPVAAVVVSADNDDATNANNCCL